MKKKLILGVLAATLLLGAGNVATVSAAVNGWITKNDQMYFYRDDKLQTGWVKTGGEWFYLDPEKKGAMVKSKFIKTNNKIYYVNAKGYRVSGVYKINGINHYFNKDGVMQTGWQKIDGYWYFFRTESEGKNKPTGSIVTSKWLKINGYHYYLGSNGKMRTGWQTIDGFNYFFQKEKNSYGPEGSLHKGWIKHKKYWYYMHPTSGKMCYGFKTVDGTPYYLYSDGKMATGWFTIGKNKYYAYSDGEVATGWVKTGGNKYYMNSKGIMQTGWVSIGGDKYYFNKSTGKLATSMWVDGEYWVDANGKWDEDKVNEQISSAGFMWPLKSYAYISSYFGGRDSPGGIGSTNHMGIDIAAAGGTPIYACQSGKIVIRQYSDSAGNYIEINHGNGLITQYMHMSKFQSGLAVGSSVKRGQVIGYVGTTGNSTGNHLHLGVKLNGVYQDPMKYVKEPN